MRLKKLFKYTGIGLGALVGVATVAFTSVWFSSALTGKVLNFVSSKVPGLSWEKVEGSFSSGVRITNLHYISQNYKYNPAVTAMPEQQEDQEVPTLVDVKVGYATLHLGLGCLVRQQFCLDNVTLDNTQVTIATGDKNKLDPQELLYGNSALQTIASADLVNPAPEEESSGGPPEWLDVVLQQAKITNLQVVVGKNIGIYQYQLNQSSEASSYKPVIANLGISTYPSSVFNPYLADPMLINLDSLTADAVRYRPHAYDLGDVSLGKLSYLQYQEQAQTQEVPTDVAQQQEPAQATPARQKNLTLRGKALPPEVQEFIKKYFNLQEGSFSQAFAQIDQAFSLQYKEDDNNFAISLPALAKDEELEQESESQTLETTSLDQAQKEQLWRSLTGYTGEFNFVEASGEGKDSSASQVSKQITKSFNFFQTPLRDYYLTNTQLNLPLELTTQNVKVGQVDVGFQSYKAEGKEVNLLTPDNFALNSISIDGNLTPESSNFKMQVAGDVELNAQVDFLARTSDTNVQLAVKIHKLPLVTLPLAVDAKVSITGKAYSALEIQATNQGENANLALNLSLDTGRAYWPLTLDAKLQDFKVNEQTQINNFSLTAQGRVNNLEAKLQTAVLYNQQNYNFSANLVNVRNKFATELVFVKENKTKLEPLAHAYLQFDYKDQLVLQGLIRAQNLKVQDFASLGSIKDLTFSGNFSLGGVYNSQQDWSIFFKQAQFQGTLDKQAFNGNLLLGVDSVHGIVAQNISADYLKNHLKIQGQVNSNSNLNIEASLVNLAKLVPGLQINSNLALNLGGNIHTPKVAGKINVPYINYQAAGTKVNINNLVADLDLAMDQSLTGNSQITLAKSQINDFVINHAKVTYAGEPDNLITIDFSSNQAVLISDISNFTLDNTGNLTAQINLKRLDLVAAQLTGFKTSAGDINLRYNTREKSLYVQPFEISNNQFNLTNEQELVYTAEKITGQLSTNVNLALLNPMLREQKIFLRGDVKATANFALDPQDLGGANSVLKVNLASERVDYNQLIDVKPFSVSLYQLDLTSELQSDKLLTNGSLQVNRQGNVALNVVVDKLFSEQRLSGSLTLDQLSLNVIKPLLDNTQRVTGVLYSNLQFGGTLRQPLLYGQAGASSLNVDMVDLPFPIVNGDLVLSFDGKGVDILGNLPTDSTPISINGKAGWDTVDKLNSNITINAQNLKAKLLDYGVALIDADITADFVNNFLTVEGTARVHDGNLTVPSSDSVSYQGPTGDVVFVTNEQLIDTQIVDNRALPSNLLAKLNVTLGDNLVFDAYGVNAHLVGNLEVTYTDTASIIGNINIENGTFRQYGQNLLVQRGEVTFNGLSLIPNVYIRAIRDPDYMMDNVTVGVQVQGLATKPTITFFSTPSSLTQNQKINYLLTGSASDSDDDGVGLQLFTSSLTSSISLFEKIGNAFGIKNTQVSTSGSGENSKVTISGTVFNKVRLNYAYGLFDGLNTISASYRLFPKVFLRVSRGVSSAADVVYSTTW
ncbi:hypothetical protein CJP74_03785 [Psittacicella melopsittaci]|uniref:Translocation and assembly module TamB C-terminal domain-containing protein n=1 Tax=Psittacicella melopsittaci TaxID=2028576 RepID=A0A3A1Y625_9GAMM|nr:translocation/assembly module TamB domain-containing protein [Psittacicella melopsittaci]RIY32736.1 hypothetical protein CJP74_03785 [Psittacicella melopsittaci]